MARARGPRMIKKRGAEQKKPKPAISSDEEIDDDDVPLGAKSTKNVKKKGNVSNSKEKRSEKSKLVADEKMKTRNVKPKVEVEEEEKSESGEDVVSPKSGAANGKPKNKKNQNAPRKTRSADLKNLKNDETEEHEESDQDENDDDEDETYVVEEILMSRQSRKKGGGVEYFVKWHGYADCTWEPAEHLINCDQILKKFEESKAAAEAAAPVVNGAGSSTTPKKKTPASTSTTKRTQKRRSKVDLLKNPNKSKRRRTNETSGESNERDESDEDFIPKKVLGASRYRIDNVFQVLYAVELVNSATKKKRIDIWSSEKVFSQAPRLMVDYWEKDARWPHGEDVRQIADAAASEDQENRNGPDNENGDDDEKRSEKDKEEDKDGYQSDGTGSFLSGKDDSSDEKESAQVDLDEPKLALEESGDENEGEKIVGKENGDDDKTEEGNSDEGGLEKADLNEGGFESAQSIDID